jgi:hypothetical protein
MASCAWLLAGVVALRCKRGHDRGLWIIALVLLIGVSAPLALMSNMWRYHLVSLAATLLVVAAVGSVMRAVPRVGARHAAIACAGVTLAAMALASRTILAPLGPCGPSTMALDREVRGWRAPLTDADRGIVSWAIPQEELNWIDAKAEACRAGTVPRLTKMMDHITWNLDPSSFTSLVTARARAVRVAFRDPAASAAAPSVVHVRADGREVATVPVTSPDWRDVVVVLRSGWLDRLRGMYRIDARLDSSDAHPRPLELGAIRIQ